MDNTTKDITSGFFGLVKNRATRGPSLIAIGSLLLYMLATQLTDTISPIVYGFAIILGIVVLAGLVFTFQELRLGEIATEDIPLPTSTDDIEYAITQLNKNYDLLRRQTTQGFILASISMILGLLVILSGSIGQLFGFVENGSSLTSIAGIIMEFIAGTALYIHNLNFKRLNKTSDELNSTWKILAAFRKAEDLPEENKTEITVHLIKELIK